MEQKEVLLLTNNRCPRCDMFSLILSKEKIEFKKDLFTKEPYLTQIRELKLRALPIFKLGSNYIQFTNGNDTLAKIKDYLEEPQSDLEVSNESTRVNKETDLE